jgi:hypothetical protein
MPLLDEHGQPPLPSGAKRPGAELAQYNPHARRRHFLFSGGRQVAKLIADLDSESFAVRQKIRYGYQKGRSAACRPIFPFPLSSPDSHVTVKLRIDSD